MMGPLMLMAKLSHPPVRPGTVRRSLVIDRLARERTRRIVSVTAPAGYGKTTLLAQWAERGEQAFAWVSVDDADNDPKILLSYVAEALNTVQPLSKRVFDALASPVSSVPGSVVPRLGSALASMTVPVVLVLDDVHLLHDWECRAALSVLADHVPAGSRLVLAGRAEPPLRTARLRAEGRLLEIDRDDLSLTQAEAATLLRDAGLRPGESEVVELHRRAEGWPAGLYLAALSLRAGGSLPYPASSFGGDDKFVSEYLESEFLARIPAGQRVFLTRTAVLERMSGPLCEAVLQGPGSAGTLAELANSNLLLVPLDRRRQWYRYHHLFRGMLLAELERSEPGLMPVLRRRAADWCLANRLPEEALEYSLAAEDIDGAARLIAELALPAYRQARVTTLQRWFGWLDSRGGIGRHPMAAVWASLIADETGRPAEAERWADAVDRWQLGQADRADDPETRAWTAVLRAITCRHGVPQMRADADEAARRLAVAGIVAPVAAFCQGFAQLLAGDPQGADEFFEKAISQGEEAGAPNVLALARCERSLLAMARGEWDQAGIFASQATDLMRDVGMDVPLLCAVQAQLAVRRGDTAAARRELTSAQRARPLLTYARPHLAVQTRIELARAHLALADPAAARTLIREIDAILRRRPELGTLVTEAGRLRARLAGETSQASPGSSALTTAELRLLPLLSTHLSFPEVAARLSLSPHTVKSQVYSIYRKLGTSSRTQAVARCRELALLEG